MKLTKYSHLHLYRLIPKINSKCKPTNKNYQNLLPNRPINFALCMLLLFQASIYVIIIYVQVVHR